MAGSPGFILQEDRKQEPAEWTTSSMMIPLLLRSSVGRWLTVSGQFSASSNKVVTQATILPHLYYLRKTMHYQTEQRGHPNSSDYRIYFSKLTAATMKGIALVRHYVLLI